MSADDIIHRYDQMYELITTKLSVDTINSIITNDEGCLRRLGQGIHDSSYACANCALIGNFVDFSDGKSTSFKLLAGKLKNEEISIVELSRPILHAKNDNRILVKYKLCDNILGRNCNSTPPEKVITVDPWVNDVVICWLISSIYDSIGLQHTLPPLGIFNCRNVGYRLTMNNSSPIKELEMTPTNATELLKQVWSAFRLIRTYDIVYPQATIENLRYNENSTDYDYHSISINSSFRVFLTNFENASIKWDNIRIIPYAGGLKCHLDQVSISYTPLVTTVPYVDTETMEKEILFRVKPESCRLFTSMRMSGYPIYPGVYDFYSMLISLLSWSPFRSAVDSTPELQRTVEALFPRKDFLSHFRPENVLTCPYRIANILSQHYLYDNIFDHLQIVPQSKCTN